MGSWNQAGGAQGGTQAKGWAGACWAMMGITARLCWLSGQVSGCHPEFQHADCCSPQPSINKPLPN